MLPVCSAAASCSFNQISIRGALPSICPSMKAVEVRCLTVDRYLLSSLHENPIQGFLFKAQARKSLYTDFVGSTTHSGTRNLTTLTDFEIGYLSRQSHPIGIMNESSLSFVDNSSESLAGVKFEDLTAQVTDNASSLAIPDYSLSTAATDAIPESPNSIPEPMQVDNGSLSSLKLSSEDLISGITESFDSTADKVGNAVKSSVDSITLSIESAVKSANEAVDGVFSQVLSAIDQTKQTASNKLTSFTGDLKEATSEVGGTAVDALRRTIVIVEESLAYGSRYVLYSYGSAKQLLPPDIRDVLNSSEDRVIKIFAPVGTAFQQVYVVIEGLERGLGLDPNDPLIPFVLFLSASVTLWVFYWAFTYGGYSGDLSPKSTLELLTGKENAVLIDYLRERDGVPDLRRGARFRYASVTLPEFDGSIRKLLKSGRDLDDSLTAAVIRNLKIVQDRSRVIVMDAEGSQSKGIARSLRKLRRPYLVKGGFQAWVKYGLRIKELKPETALTVLNEEAEAIIEDINPTPLKVFGFGLGFIVAIYALTEWERTLQLVGVVGLGQTVYRRIASYEDSEDFKKDVRLLLSPVRLGAQAVTWVAGKLETNGIGLPTSPSSSSAVQNRVLQAAAKHESQPSDSEEVQDQSPESTAPITKNVDLSEA
ncbi:hypothetical protein RJ641_021789 [Dillenia turbinata]|uniref:Rhodanese domain-containing protein n=1 Tax=Dillenia turbinata TaxID=194707 RepID=A0AAN8UCR2_9MAGN